MSRSHDEVEEVLSNLVETVVQAEAQQQMREAPEDGTRMTHPMEQFGGAIVKVLKKGKEVIPKEYLKHFENIKLEVRLPKAMTMGPLAPENFGEMVVELIEKFAPDNANEGTRVGVTFESPEFEAGSAVGLPFTPLAKVESRSIVQTMEMLSQSNKSPLEIQTPSLQIYLKYITPPSGSGKRRSEFGIKDVLESNLFDKRSRHQDNEEEEEEIGVLDLMDDAAEETEDEEDSDFELDVDGEVMEGTKLRPNVMKNEVDFDCLPMAAVHGASYNQAYHGTTPAEKKKGWALYRQSLRNCRTKPNQCLQLYAEVRELKRKAGITKSFGFDYEDIKKIQDNVFNGKFQIIVIVEHQSTPYFAGPFLGDNKTITLFLKEVNGEGHYAAVRKLPALLRTKFYCCLCMTRSGSVATHYNCPRLHQPCGALHCPTAQDDAAVCCIRCTAVFRSNTCLENHLKKGKRKGKSRCDNTKICKKCGDIYYINKSKVTAKHECGKKWCKRCNRRRPGVHHCILPVSIRNEDKLFWKRFAYDFEALADDETGEQIPILFIALRYCRSCSSNIPAKLSEALGSTCKDCAPNGRCKVIDAVQDDNRFVDVAEEAVEWIFSKEHKDFVGIAHNASGYDAQFILKALVSSNKASPKVIMAGTKIICLQHRGVKLIDSLKFLTMNLAMIGKDFQVPTEKGDFPVKFIKRENFDYVGPIPSNDFYNLDHKPPAVRAKLIELLDNDRAQGKQFHFIQDLMKYCFEDVFILAHALSRFEKTFETASGICLFEESVTAASASIKTFQRGHIDEKKPIVLDARPSASRKSSVDSQKYLAWLAEQEKVDIAFSATTGERKVTLFEWNPI